MAKPTTRRRIRRHDLYTFGDKQWVVHQVHEVGGERFLLVSLPKAGTDRYADEFGPHWQRRMALHVQEKEEDDIPLYLGPYNGTYECLLDETKRAEERAREEAARRREAAFKTSGAVPHIRQRGCGPRGFYPYIWPGKRIEWQPANEASDYALMVIMTRRQVGKVRFTTQHKARAAREWRRRHPQQEPQQFKSWARQAHAAAAKINATTT